MQQTETKKHVIVIDEHGKRYESTYLKRAKGLVKSGRAHFVDEHTICLMCPPKQYILEDNKMNNNNESTRNKDVSLINSVYIMDKIDEILKMNQEAINKNYDLQPTVEGGLHPVQAICETNNRMIQFLKEIYQSLLPKEAYLAEKMSVALTDSLEIAIESGNEEIATQILSTITHLSTMK
ncbi:MAG: hypothetical protein NC090_05230 [Anaeroplasma bactoclasticum]|nr:hypothetical protein [Anaeroplasma bactoclasticum]